mmetsp:Transcript_22584/g.52614  ORF Transcript_22584/g.52614 Transcript_22584/m.52614 type:complete len:248 (-) Transcript_22584:386-1129(-)
MSQRARGTVVPASVPMRQASHMSSSRTVFTGKLADTPRRATRMPLRKRWLEACCARRATASRNSSSFAANCFSSSMLVTRNVSSSLTNFSSFRRCSPRNQHATALDMPPELLKLRSRRSGLNTIHMPGLVRTLKEVASVSSGRSSNTPSCGPRKTTTISRCSRKSSSQASPRSIDKASLVAAFSADPVSSRRAGDLLLIGSCIVSIMAGPNIIASFVISASSAAMLSRSESMPSGPLLSTFAAAKSG